MHEFQSTRPMRGATGRPLSPCADTLRFQSTRPMRGATFYILPTMRARDISIHAPHAGRDAGDKYITGSNCISIHAPLAGCDVEHIQHTVWFSPYFNPRAPCGARLRSEDQTKGERYFNPRAPCGARLLQSGKMSQQQLFQSTRPVRGATPGPKHQERRREISIHAPRAGRDFCSRYFASTKANFNPRAPCGARPGRLCGPRGSPRFQSTRPVRGATTTWCVPATPIPNFNPRAPCGARPGAEELPAYGLLFQSTRPVRGATR